MVLLKKLSPSNFQFSKIITKSFSSTSLSNNEVWFWQMSDLDSNGTGVKTDNDSGVWLRSSRYSIMTLVSLPDYFSILESTLNPVQVHYEIESPVLSDHTSLMQKVCEHQFFGLDRILNQFWLSLLSLDLIWVKFSESVSVFVFVPFECKSIISQNNTSLLDKDVEENDWVIIFENWKLDGDNFFNKTIHSIILLLGRIREVIGGFL